jgi:hypothetical protein
MLLHSSPMVSSQSNPSKGIRSSQSKPGGNTGVISKNPFSTPFENFDIFFVNIESLP